MMIKQISFFVLVIIIFSMSLVAQEKDKLYPFPDFKSVLKQKLINNGAQPDKQAYHFVVIMNTTDTEGPVALWMRNIYHGLLSNYMISGDIISFVPYQLKVRDDYTYWSRIYKPEDLNILNGKIPTRPAIEDGYDGGHDDEGALLTAINKISSESAIYILLTDSGASSRPRNETQYKLTNISDLQTTLDKDNILKLAEIRYDKMVEDKGKKNPFTIFCKIYASANIKPLGPISGNREVTKSIDQTEKPEEKHIINVKSSSSWWIIPLLIIAGAIIGYLVWLNKPRSIQIGSISSSVKYGKRYYLGGENAGSNIIVYPGVPSTQRIVMLEVTCDGKVFMKNEGIYRVSKGIKRDRVKINSTSEIITITDNQTEEILYEFAAKTTD